MFYETVGAWLLLAVFMFGAATAIKAQNTLSTNPGTIFFTRSHVRRACGYPDLRVDQQPGRHRSFYDELHHAGALAYLLLHRVPEPPPPRFF